MSLVVEMYFQHLFLAQPSQCLFISNTMSGTADARVWAGIGMSIVQILELMALTHVAHEILRVELVRDTD